MNVTERCPSLLNGLRRRACGELTRRIVFSIDLVESVFFAGTLTPSPMVVPRLHVFDFFWPGHPQTSGRSDLTLRLGDDVLDTKVEALRAHASQMEPLFDAYGENFIRAVEATEDFRVGKPGLTAVASSVAARIRRAWFRYSLRNSGFPEDLAAIETVTILSSEAPKGDTFTSQ